MNDVIQVACTLDNNYAQHAAVMLCSLFTNNPKNAFKVHIFHSGLSHVNEEGFQALQKAYAADISVYWINENSLGQVPTSHHISNAAYFRLLLPQLLPESIPKVLYLDCDLLVRSDLRTLWETRVLAYPLAACPSPIKPAIKQNLGMDPDSQYFNSGVMLINLDHWRKDETVLKALDFIQNNRERIVFWDQDVLNHLFEKKWLPLSYRWNVIGDFYEAGTPNSKLGLAPEQFAKIQANPFIVHFTGQTKPWQYMATHPYKKEYFQYLKMTPWKDYIPEDKTYGNMLRKYKLMPKLVDRLLAKRT